MTEQPTNDYEMTETAASMIQHASSAAGDGKITSAHLLFALSQAKGSVAAETLKHLGVEPDAIREHLSRLWELGGLEEQ